MSRYSLIPVMLIAFAVISCQPKEREAVTTTTQTATASATDTIAEVPPAATSTIVPTATVTSTVVTTTMTTTAPVTPAVKPATTPAPKPVAATPKASPEVSTPETPPPTTPAPAAEPATKPAESTPAKAEEPVAGTQPAKAPTTTRKPPKTHTVDHGGVKHAPGSDNATQKCVVCHGKDLRGGRVAKASCYECHEKVWK